MRAASPGASATVNEPLAIEPARFFEFIASSEIAVVLLSVHPAHAFNRGLCERLAEHEGAEVAFGVVPLVQLALGAGNVLVFLSEGLRDCGSASPLGALPGYWLFRGGRVLAWHPGLPAGADAKTIARNAFLSALWAGIKRRWSTVAEVLYAATEDVAAARIATSFRSTLAGHGQQATASGSHAYDRRGPRTTPFRGPADELGWAYRVLGVAPSASDQEVKDAWRKRRVEAHPDRAGDDPAEFERRSQMSAEINRARDVIFGHRGRRERRAA
jgi:hypothetical protein